MRVHPLIGLFFYEFPASYPSPFQCFDSCLVWAFADRRREADSSRWTEDEQAVVQRRRHKLPNDTGHYHYAVFLGAHGLFKRLHFASSSSVASLKSIHLR